MEELVKKIAKIQQELKAPKNQRNNFGGYNYRSCEDILEAVKPLLGSLILTINDEVVEVGGRIYVKATATITDGKNSVSNSAFARESESRKGMDDSQITGATSSYARKYALNGLLCIDDTKDADATNTHGRDEPTPAEKARATREENKAREDDLADKARKTIEWIKNLNRDMTKEESLKVEMLLNQMSTKGLRELGDELAGLIMDKDKIIF